MRTLKKVLALTVVIAFAFTMMAGATTVFTDDSSINAQDQVNLVYALGIMKGYPDGSFGADKTITRAEAAKMMYVIKNGKDVGADNYKSSANPFTDVTSDNWAKGYINYCYMNGIIAGVGNGKFNPNGDVTGAQLAKMLLAVIGYDAKKANLTGSQWMISTMSLAFENKLFDDYAADVSAAAPREDAAVIFYNTIFTPTVRYTDGEYVNYNSDNNDLPTVGAKNFNLVEYKGVLVGANNFEINPQGGTADDTIYLDRNGNLSTWVTTGDDKDLALDYTGDAKALVGQYVKVVYDDNKDRVYNIVPTDDNAVYNVKIGDIDAGTAATQINFDDDDYTLAPDASLVVYKNYGPATLNFVAPGAGGYRAEAVAYLSGTDASDPVRLVDYNGDDVIDYAFVTDYTFSYVSSKDSKSIDFGEGGIKFLDSDENTQVFADGINEGDYVLYYKDEVNDNYYLFPATKVTGDVTGVKGSDIKVNGAYISKNSKVIADVEDASASFDTDDIGDNFIVYTDGQYYCGVISNEESSAGSGNYVYVTAAQNWVENGSPAAFDDTIAKVEVLMPGEDDPVTYELSDDSTYGTGNTSVGDMSGIAGTLVGKFFAYTITSDGKIELSQDFGASNYVTGANMAYDEDTNVFTATTAGAGSYLMRDDAVIFYEANYMKAAVSTQEYKVYGAKDFDTTFAATTGAEVSFYYKSSGGFKYIVAAKISTSTNATAPSNDTLKLQGGTASDTVYGYSLANEMQGYNKADDDTYYEYSLWVGGKAVTVDNYDAHPTVAKRDFVSYKLNADGHVKDGSLTVDPGFIGAIKAYNSTNKMLTLYTSLTGSQYQSIYSITDDTVIDYIDDDNCAGTTGTSFPKISAVDLAANKGNVYYVEDPDNAGELLYLAIDTTAELD